MSYSRDAYEENANNFEGASGQRLPSYQNRYNNSNYKKSNTMSYGNNNQGPRISNDRFGNPFQLKFAKIAVNKKEGNTVEGCFGAYFELGGKLYKVEVSPANKQDKNGNEGVWLKVTAKAKQSNVRRSM